MHQPGIQAFHRVLQTEQNALALLFRGFRPTGMPLLLPASMTFPPYYDRGSVCLKPSNRIIILPLPIFSQSEKEMSSFPVDRKRRLCYTEENQENIPATVVLEGGTPQ